MKCNSMQLVIPTWCLSKTTFKYIFSFGVSDPAFALLGRVVEPDPGVAFRTPSFIWSSSLNLLFCSWTCFSSAGRLTSPFLTPISPFLKWWCLLNALWNGSSKNWSLMYSGSPLNKISSHRWSPSQLFLHLRETSSSYPLGRIVGWSPVVGCDRVSEIAEICNSLESRKAANEDHCDFDKRREWRRRVSDDSCANIKASRALGEGESEDVCL